MFKRKPTFEEQALEAEAQRILDLMNEWDPDSTEYQTLMTRYKELGELRPKRTWNISSDTLVIVAGNLIGILIIVAYEQRNVLTTKALNFTVKPK